MSSISSRTIELAVMPDDPIGFDARKPIGFRNKRLGLEGTGLFKAALKAALGYLTANPAAAVSATIDGAFAIQTKPLPPEEQAWLLIQRALARAMAKLAAEARQREVFETADVQNLVASLDQGLAKRPVRIGRDFVDHPADHDVLDAIRPGFTEWLTALGLGEIETAHIIRRLGAYFTFSLHREWTTHHKEYGELERTIESWSGPFAKASGRERAWMRNAAWLQRQVEEHLFDETFGLCEVYVPLRAYWVEKPKDERRRITAEEGVGSHRERRHVVDLRTAVRGWLDEPDKDDPIRVISGGPGSGKTSFARMLAAELAPEAAWRVLYIPLHLFEFAGELRSAVRKFAIEDLHILEHDPLNPAEEARRLVVFFDGLDELAMHGASGQEAASSFVDALDRAIGTIDHRECRLQVILGGREIVVQANERVFRRERQVLHVLPYVVPKRDEAPRQDLLHREDLDDPDGLLAADQRDLWWQKYGAASGRGHTRLPEPLAAPELIEISGQPLMNYLLALSFDRGRIDFGRNLNLNELYEDLLDAVWVRRWGEGRQLPEVEKLERAEFEQLLEEVGLAAWHAGTRGVSASRIADICRDTGLGRELRSFEAGAEKGALTLLAAFYFRQASRTGERTFEFTHKSFGEYLTARRIVAIIEEIDADRRYEEGRSRGQWDREKALEKWLAFTGPAALDQAILSFLTREAALRAAAPAKEGEPAGREAISRSHETMVELFSHQLHHGLPMLRCGLPSFREITRQARNAEEALLAAVFTCANALTVARDAEDSVRSEVDWPSAFSLRDLIARLDQGQPNNIVRDCLGWLDTKKTADGARIRHILSWARLTGASLTGAKLGGANLFRADLFRADLFRADLFRADFAGANLSEANLLEATLQGANLGGANLGWANLEDANLVRANLVRSNLGGANLERANLVGANLEGAYLGGANLGRANLEGAYLQGAHLERADLEHANLEGANLERANLVGANLERANLHGANLEGAYLGGANLERANLVGANLRHARMNRSLVRELELDAEALQLDVVEDDDERPEDADGEGQENPT